MRFQRFVSIRFSPLACLLVGALVVAPAVRAAPRDGSSAGLVDGSAFAALANDDDSIVEIHLSGALLSTIARADSEDEGFGAFLRGLRSIEAYIVKLGDDSARIDKAVRLVRETETKLEQKGWERIARVREQSANVNIFVRHSDPYIDGLVILVVDREDGEVVFANIAGRIDLARLGELSQMVKIRGLESIGDSEKPPRPPHSKHSTSDDAKPDEDR